MANLLSIFEDLTGLERPLWRDAARYQMYYNHAIAALNGVMGIFARAGISWGYHDPFFRHIYDGAKGLMYRSSYHVLYPSQDVVQQADKVWYVEQPEIDIIPRAIDLELSNDQYWERIGDQAWNMSELVLSRDGARPIIYSRYKLIEKWLRKWTPEMMDEHYWFLAQYRYVRSIEHAGPPTLPKYIFGGAGALGADMITRDHVILHQTADKKAPFPGEVPTPYAGKSADWDRWELGTKEEMHAFIKNTWGEGNVLPPPPDPELELPARIGIKLDVPVGDVSVKYRGHVEKVE